MIKNFYAANFTASPSFLSPAGLTTGPGCNFFAGSTIRHLLKKYNHLLIRRDGFLSSNLIFSDRKSFLNIIQKCFKNYLARTFIYLYICPLFLLNAFSIFRLMNGKAKHFLGLKLNRPIFSASILYRETHEVPFKTIFRNQTLNT